MESWFPNAKRLPITTGEFFYPRGRAVVSIVDHISDGLDSRNHLQNVVNGSSATFLIRMENGKAVTYQFMDLEHAAYANGIWSEDNPYMPDWIRSLLPDLRANRDNLNRYTVNIEHEMKYAPDLVYPTEMIEESTRLHKWLIETVPTIKIDRDHIIGHYQIDHIRRANCPGGPGGALFPFDDIIAAIKAPVIPPSMDVYVDAVTGFVVAHGFLAYMKDHPNLGHPLSNEESGDSAPWNALPELSGFVCQLFERGALAWRMGWPVVEVRTGALVLALAA